MATVSLERCSWPGSSELMVKYHDEEWGLPCHDEQKLFEYMVLDAFQAGLSWAIVLNKREGFRRAFDGFNPQIIASYGEGEIQSLLQNPAIIRNQLKIRATVTNAQVYLKVQKEFGSFDAYIWGFVSGKTVANRLPTNNQIPASSPESDAMSADLKQRGFKFCGSTICYAFMQAAGLVNDHDTTCFRYDLLHN